MASGMRTSRCWRTLAAHTRLRPYFASCRLLATYHAPHQVQNDWTGIQIAICTRPAASWAVLWPHLKHDG
jgi:hypothetical protein